MSPAADPAAGSYGNQNRLGADHPVRSHRDPTAAHDAYRQNGHPALLVTEAEEAQGRAAFERARAGERGAYGTVVRVYQHRLFNAVFRMVGNREDAAEVTQEAFTRGLEKLADFRGDSGPYTWLFRIAMNAAVSRIRRSSRRRTVSLDAPESARARHGATSAGGARSAENVAGTSRSPADAAQATEAHRAVVAALEQLDPEYRALLVMRDMEGFDYRQMADVLGLPLGTLKSRLFRARMALRDLLAPQFDRKEEPPGNKGAPQQPQQGKH